MTNSGFHIGEQVEISARCELDTRARTELVLVVFSWVLVVASAALAVEAPFRNGDVICRSDFLKLDNIKKLIIPVPGKAGEMGVLEHEEFDSKGNRIQVWCLEAGNGHGGPDLGLLYKPNAAKDAGAVWIGACTFGSGQNGYQTKWKNMAKLEKAIQVYNFMIKSLVFEDESKKKLTEVKGLKAGSMPVKEVADEFMAIRWHNYEGPPNGVNDWDYCYDLVGGNTCKRWDFEKSVKDKLTIQKTEGKYEKGGTKYEITKDEEQDPVDAPGDFKDLKYGGKSITAFGNGDFSSGSSAFRLVQLGPSVSPFEYALLADSWPALGTYQNPFDTFVGEEAEIEEGDVLTIQAVGVSSARVEDPAAMPEFGGWVVLGFDDLSVSFIARNQAVLDPGTQVSGFLVYSNASPGIVPWGLGGINTVSGSQSFVSGPATCDPNLLSCGR